MTNPALLSPAAQAVLDVVTEICPAPADEIAAAALRAASSQLTNAKAIDQLHAIAADLEGAND